VTSVETILDAQGEGAAYLTPALLPKGILSLLVSLFHVSFSSQTALP
jgi:hypothetical protein